MCYRAATLSHNFETMTRAFFLLLAIALVASACQTPETVSNSAPSAEDVDLTWKDYPSNSLEQPLSKAEINALAQEQLDRGNVVRWDQMNAEVLWSAVNQTDSLVSIGYQPSGTTGLDSRIHRVDVDDQEWAPVREALIAFILEETNRRYPGKQWKKEDVLAYGEKPLPYINVRIWDYDILARLRNMEVTRYVEPMGYGTEIAQRSGSGCGSNGPDYSIPSSDYTIAAPNAKVSWNYSYANIETAWEESQGDNVTIGVIDTGLSPNQNKLNSQFSSGWSTGRTREAYGFYESCWWWWCWNEGPNDECGHGTSMAGTAVAPRTSAGNTTGVAYKANLISCKGTTDVIINGSGEKDGVSDALYYLGSRGDVDIISMSIGDVFYSGQVADAVNYAYNQGKLIFSAAGTSLSWTSWWGVIFPANMSQTVAVTGVQTGMPLKKCVECHDGSAVDFVCVMQDRTNSGRNAITMADYSDQPSETGGSSVATATTAGIAALVWAEDLNQSRAQVLQRMKEASQFYPARDNNFGWGIVDASVAVGLVP